MTFCIITHVVHIKKNKELYAYSPYVNEMNIWIKYVDKVIIIAPLKKLNFDSIHQKYNHKHINLVDVPEFSLTSFKEIIKSFFVVPFIFFKIIRVMMISDHIHLRCPGNIGLLGSLSQIFFRSKFKTAKYAGNWDSSSKQPISYKIQKWIISNAFLTKNMKVLVYGEWKNQSKNIKPFFTATYSQSEIIQVEPRNLNDKIKIIFVGMLTKGKQPLYVIKIVEALKQQNFDIELSIYGDGIERKILEDYIQLKKLNSYVFLKGNTDRESMKTIYQKSHCLVLPSKSEGWPKVVAEAMFWGCLPVSTPVSCVPGMFNFGERGLLLTEKIEIDVDKISDVLLNQEEYNKKIKSALKWSHQYTIDRFEQEIKILLQQ